MRNVIRRQDCNKASITINQIKKKKKKNVTARRFALSLSVEVLLICATRETEKYVEEM